MKAGDLRHRVTLKTATYADTATNAGGKTRTLSAGTTVWARVRRLSGNEAALVAAVQGQVFYEVTMRNTTGLAKDLYVVWTSGGVERTLEVTAVLPDPKNQWVRILAREERPPTT